MPARHTMSIIHIYYCKLQLTEQALWGEHGAVIGKQAQPIWNVLTSNCMSWDSSFTSKQPAPAI